MLAKLRALGHDTAELRSKSWNEITGVNAPHMEFVITLCDKPRGDAWPLPDRAIFNRSHIERAALLNELYASLRRRIEIFAALSFAPSIALR